MNICVKLNDKDHQLYLDVPEIMEGDKLVKDERTVAAFTKIANTMVATFNVICNQPFSLQLREIHVANGSESYMEVFGVDDEGNEVFLRDEGNNTKVVMRQSYIATNLQKPEESYVGSYEVVAIMACPEVSDGDAIPVENPLAQILAKLTCFCYSAVILEDYPEWVTQYINSPKVEYLVMPAKP